MLGSPFLEESFLQRTILVNLNDRHWTASSRRQTYSSERIVPSENGC